VKEGSACLRFMVLVMNEATLSSGTSPGKRASDRTNMKWSQVKFLTWIVLISLAVTVVGVVTWKGNGWRILEDRVYRIGWNPDPPFQAEDLKGQATGLAVELVREAARRRGVRLEWVRQPGGPDGALRDRKVDLWPLITIIPERSGYIHFTEPYLETEHSFLVRAESAYTKTQDLSGALISHNGERINDRNLRTLLPNARLLSSPGTKATMATMENVCQRRVDAAYVEEYTALSALLGGLSCSGQELRLIPIPEVRPRLGVGSTFAASAAADAIREEISEIASEGKLPTTLSRWNYFSRRNLESIQALRESRRATWLLTTLVSLLLGVLLITAWLTNRTLREQRKARWAEEQLGATQQNYRLLTEQAADGVFMADKDGKFLLVNSRMCEMLGYTDAEMRQLTLQDTYFPDERESGRQRLTRITCGTSASFERQMRRKDGNAVLVEASVVRLGDGRVQEIVRDITDRKRAELALRESEERFRNMADSAPVMIWVAGPDKVLTFFNKTWLEFVGRTLEQELGNGWIQSVHPDDLDYYSARYSSAFDARAKFHVEYRLRRADGEYRRVLCSGVPRFTQDGIFAGYIGSDIDITDLRRAQEEALARQKLESLGVLTTGIAHDFNNLLGGILASVELALSEHSDGTLDEKNLVRIRTAAIRGGEIVRQLMNYGGVEGQVLESVDISVLVGEMLELLKVSISKCATLKIDLPEGLSEVRANAAQIRQVVMNLITNASEALEEREGVISVSVAELRLCLDCQVPNLSEGNYIRLEVSDSGQGMTEEIQTRIFDPFFTTRFAGRGLGLAAVQGIIRSHGGAIDVVSAPGQGSRFEVFLPCVGRLAGDGGDIVGPFAASEDETSSHAILVVEDEEILRVAVSAMLRKHGVTVIEAADGKEGIDLFRANSQHIDVVLLDMTLPGLSGREVVPELRRIQPDVNLIITTAYSENWALEAIGGQEAWFYIRKPYRFDELEGLLRKACSERPVMRCDTARG
jgi:two-component system cell cycle sensor histidine kinase/response regulator CckA